MLGNSQPIAVALNGTAVVDVPLFHLGLQGLVVQEIRWIHSVSRDLIHWKKLEPAFREGNLDAGTGPHAVTNVVRDVEIMVDRASIESFATQGGISCTHCFHPAGEGRWVTAEGGKVTLRPLSVTPLKSIRTGTAAE